MLNWLKNIFKKKSEWEFSIKLYQNGECVFESTEPYQIKDEDEFEYGRIYMSPNDDEYKKMLSKKFEEFKERQRKMDINLKDSYQNKSSGVVVKIKALNFSNDVIIDYNNIISYFTAEEFRRSFIKYNNPFIERKEMCYEKDLNYSSWYSVAQMEEEVVYTNDIEFYKKKNTGELFALIDNGWCKSSHTYNTVLGMKLYRCKEKTPARKLKLEDLNKIWLNIERNLIGTIYINSDKIICFVNKRGVESVLFGGYSIDRFFELYREATQDDIDNLTKGN